MENISKQFFFVELIYLISRVFLGLDLSTFSGLLCSVHTYSVVFFLFINKQSYLLSILLFSDMYLHIEMQQLLMDLDFDILFQY